MKITQHLLLCLVVCLVSACDRDKPVSSIPENKTRFNKVIFTQPNSGETIKLISETKCEIDNKESILLAEYTREDNKLRIVTRVSGTDSVSYLELFSEGLRTPKGEFLLPEALNKARELDAFEKETGRRLARAKSLGLACFCFIQDSKEQTLNNFEQLRAYLPEDSPPDSSWEFVYRGNINSFTNPTKTILFREKEARQSPDGKFVKTYGFADFSVESLKSRNGDFVALEKQRGFLIHPAKN